MAKKRKNGNGTLRLRKDGRWEGRLVIGYDDNGYPKTKNVLAKTKAECSEKLKKLKLEFETQKPDQVCMEMRFGDWLEFWYQNYSKPRLRANTQMQYECCLYKHIIPELGAMALNQIETNDLQRFYASLKKDGRINKSGQKDAGLSDRTVRVCHVVCRMAFERAVREKLIHTNPAIGCRLPPKKGREMSVLSRDEMQRFIIQTKQEDFYELFILDLCTGLRRGELLALKWEDLNFETGELRVERQVIRTNGQLNIAEPKTKASRRTIILPQSLLVILKKYAQTVDSRWIFPSPVNADMPRDPAAVRKRLQIILEHAQCKAIRFHDLRHTFATTALEYGMDIKTLSEIMGHDSVEVTLDIYSHITDPMRREAAAKIDRGIGKNEAAYEECQPAKEGPEFEPYIGKRRKSGTGCLRQLNDELWEGRYSPKWTDGKRRAENVYAKTKEECEEKLNKIIVDMKAELAQEKFRSKTAPQ